MNHAERCQLLLSTFKTLGYDPIDNGQRGIFTGKSRDPDDCNQGYIFEPQRGPNGQVHNYQMFRGYVHDTEDIVYLRINIPGIPYGLGRKPLEVKTDASFATQVESFCCKISVSAAVIDQLIHEHCQRTQGTKKMETVDCVNCDGSGKWSYPANGYQDICQLCHGKGTRKQVTERYFVAE